MCYDVLLEKVVRAKRLKVTHNLTGLERSIVYYFYAELINGIKSQIFRTPGKKTINARVILFEIRFGHNIIYIETVHHYGRRIKAFKCQKDEMEEIIKAIESAMEIVGLEVEKQKTYQEDVTYDIIYNSSKNKEVTE